MTDPEAQRALSAAVRYAHAAGVAGDVAEFGTYSGVSACELARSMRVAQHAFGTSDNLEGIAQRTLWLFDSFEGLPEATSSVDTLSPHVSSGVWKWKAKIDHEVILRACEQALAPGRVRVVKGWYKDTLTQIPADARFALVHVDCDLYESTVEVLTHLVRGSHLSDGCSLMFDDFYCNRGSPMWGEQRALRDVCERFGLSSHLSDVGAYGLLGRRFIYND